MRTTRTGRYRGDARDLPSRLLLDIEARAYAEALRSEAHCGLVRAGKPPPPYDRAMARALVDAGYMPLADYVAIYGDEAAQPARDWSVSVSARFVAAIPRRNVYRATSVHCSLSKPAGRLSRRRA
jgi:hypothetical protein